MFKTIILTVIVIISQSVKAIDSSDVSFLRICNPIDLLIKLVDNTGEFEISANIANMGTISLFPETAVVKITVENSDRKRLSSLECKPSEKVKIKIPQTGEVTVFCEVLTDKLSVIGQRTIIFKDGIPLNAEADSASPVIITLAPFCDFTRCPKTTNQVMHIRDKVIANLIQNYNVVVLSRSNSMALVNEEKLHAISNLDKKDLNKQHLCATDIAITGYFNIARKTPGHASNVDLGTVLLISDLNNSKEDNYRKIEFIPNEPKLFDGDITKEIVKALKLKPKKQKTIQTEGQQLDETWAVMPISRLESESTMNAPADKGLALDIELVLQESGRVKRIVDHADIDKLVEELQISSFEIAAGSASGKIAGLLGADKIITGVVGQRFFTKKGLRVDLFLVDAKTGITLGAVSAAADTNNLNEVIKKLVLELAQNNNSIMEVKKVDAAFLKKEAELYEEILFNWSDSTISSRNIAVMAKAFAEIIYLIEGNDDQKIYKVAKYFLTRILTKDLPNQKSVEIANFIDEILKPVKYSKEIQYPLLYRAEALCHDSRRIEEALVLANRHINEYPDLNPGYANFIIGECYFKKHDYENALKFAEKAGENNGAKYLLIDVYRALQDKSNDGKELECLKYLNVIRDSMGYNVVRRLQLTREIEGAEAALEYFNHLSSWTKVRPEILLEVVKANLTIGRKKEAGNIINGIADDMAWRRTCLKNLQMIDDLKKESFKLKNELKEYIVPWKTSAQILKIPDKYKFYIRPIGHPDMNLITKSIPLIEEFYGCRVEVLPCLPMPEDPYCFKKGRGQYNSYSVQQRLKRLVPCPPDAIAISEITDKNIYCRRLKYVYGSPYYGSYLISYYHWFGQGNEFVLTDMLAKTVCNAFKIICWERCQQPLCLSSGDGTAAGCKYKRFLLCPECLQALSKKTSDWIFHKFQSEYEWNPKASSEDKKEWQDEYNKIVKKTLEEAREKAEEEAKKPVDYQPAVDLTKKSVPGLKYQYFEFDQDAVKTAGDLAKLSPKETGVTDAFNLGKAKREKNYGLIFEGYIKILEDGKDQFYLTSDDGSRLWIDDKEVIENDKMQAPTTKMAEVALKAGYHKIKLAYIQGVGGAFLTLYWRGTKTLGQQIPAEVLFHQE